MAHDNPHFEDGFCECWCTSCHQMSPEIRCICPKCSCTKPVKLSPKYFREEEKSATERVCENCGDPVFRNGNRGRFPKYCGPCKSA